MEVEKENSVLPLAGVRVLEMGQLLAGPFAGMLLGWFGAEVIKIESPGAGDPLRRLRRIYKGTSLWWYSFSRNKKSVTLNLRDRRGQEVARRLAAECDVLIENFKPGTLERWGLGPDELKRINPRLILSRISGYGQTGPNAARPGFANVAEGFGGMRYVTGYPDRPPARANLSLGDTLAGLHAAFGAMVALYHRDRTGEGGAGQVVDVALYEAVFNMMESLVPEYDKLGEVRERQGTKLSGVVPTNTYTCKDGKYIIIGGNGDAIFKRLMRAAKRPEMADDARFETNDGRVKHEAEIDRAIEAWTREHTYAELMAMLEEADVPAGPVYNAREILSDPHYRARGMIEEVEIGEGERLKLPSIAPQMSLTPGATRWAGPRLGAHNDEVYGGLLGMSAEEMAELRAEGVI